MNALTAMNRHRLLLLALATLTLTLTAPDARPARADESVCASNARAAVREVERAELRAAIAPQPGLFVTPHALLFVDGPEVPLDWLEWAEEVGVRRMRHPTTTDTVVRVRPGMTLVLANLSGDIAVQVWNRNEVRVQAEHDRDDRVVAEFRDDTLRLRVRPREVTPAEVEWKLTVPAWLPLELSGMESEIAVTGMRSSVRARSMRGDVMVRGCQGPLEVNSVEGEVHVVDVSGNVSAGSVNNIIRMVRVTGSVEAQTINGDIQLEKLASSSVDASTVNGRVYFASPFQAHGRYAFASHNGKLYVGLPKYQKVNVTLSSFNGQVESSLPVPPRAPHTRGRAQRFTLGELPTLPGTPRAPRTPRPLLGYRASERPSPGAAPQAPELELESFGGLIMLASQEETLRAIDVQRASLDSARATILRVRRDLARMRRADRSAPTRTPAEAPTPPPPTPAPHR